MRDNLLKKLAYWHVNHSWKMLAGVIMVTIILAVFASQLSINMQTKSLLPEGDLKVDQFNKIIDEFATATSIIVVVQGKENKIKAFADELAPRIVELTDTTRNAENLLKISQLRMKIARLIDRGYNEKKITALQAEIDQLQRRIDFKLFQRVDYKADTEFLRHHALMLIKAKDLKNTKDTFTNSNLVELLNNINNSMEKEYVGQEESISTREKEDGAVGFLDGIETLITRLSQAAQGNSLSREEIQAAADKFLLGEPYFLSYDKSTLILNVIPNFTIMDRDLLMVAAEETQALVDKLLQKHPDVCAGLSGDIAREHDEQIYSQQSLSYTTFIAFAAILILLIIAFRMWVAPALAIVTLLVGIIWANGLAYLVVGQLNMMTAMLSIVLLGLGIDFSIHIIAGMTEWRAAGYSIAEAIQKTFLKNGKGVITGALTTSCAFLALLVSQSRGMKEMGIVTGVGLVAILLATFLFLPVMLVFRERFVAKRQKKKTLPPRDVTLRALGRWTVWLSKHYVLTITASLLISAFLIWSALHIKYEQNYLKMEPEGLTSIALGDTITEKFDLSMEYGLCLTDNVEESRTLAKKFRNLSTVAMTSDISAYLPSPEEQQQRAPYLTQIRGQMQAADIEESIQAPDLPRLKAEIERLNMNIMEMQDMAFLGGQDKVDNKCKQLAGDPDNPASENKLQNLLDLLDHNNEAVLSGLTILQKYFAPYFKSNVLQMCSTEPITLKDLPVSVLDRYSNRTRDKFVITIYPSGKLWADATLLNRFVEEVEQVSPKTTGTPVITTAWLRIAARDGRNAILLTLLIVFLLLWIDFRKPHYALIAMIPLALGVFWMVGIMNLSGILLSFMTMMGLPLIIGIGIDDGVHIMHRWQNEGYGRLQTVFSSAGRAILLTSLTTMLAFGSMTFSVFPAWAWFGESLFIGVAACFLTTVIILPGILGMIERKKNR